jgi:predicted DCC family thiol-disulfide oxidoreductase YuxK
MKNGWTGGQYSLVRAVFGLYLFLHFAQLIPWAAELFSRRGVLADGSASPLLHLFPNVLALWDGPIFVTGLVAVAAALSVLFAAGWHDRAASVALWYVWACLHGRMPLIANPGLPYVGWMLLAHAFLPAAPYGSWAARGRVDPGQGWRMREDIFLVAWILMAAGYTYSGCTKFVSPSWLDGTALARVMENPLARPGPARDLFVSLPAGIVRLMTWGALCAEVSFAPLALVPRLRPWIWSLMLAMHLGLMVLIDFADLSMGMVMLHLFTFDPAWVRPRPADAARSRAAAPATGMIFYDGDCGLCHRVVRFVLAEDETGGAFRFAPLDSAAFRSAVPDGVREGLPDSLVAQTEDGRVLIRAAAIRHILSRLGGLWRVAAVVSGVFPARLLDRGYDAVARVRRRLFAAPPDACPVVPKHLRERFSS